MIFDLHEGEGEGFKLSFDLQNEVSGLVDLYKRRISGLDNLFSPGG